MSLRLVTFMLFTFITTSLFSQQLKVNKLMLFLQKTFDSSIILHSFSSEYIHPDYKIIARVGTSTYYYSYSNPYNLIAGLNMPDDLFWKFNNEDFLFRQTEPDTNRYFLPVYVNHLIKGTKWNELSAAGVWELKEFKLDESKCVFFHAPEYNFYFITKGDVRKLRYYAPEYYDTCAPAHAMRRKVLGTLKIFQETFDLVDK